MIRQVSTVIDCEFVACQFVFCVLSSRITRMFALFLAVRRKMFYPVFVLT